MQESALLDHHGLPISAQAIADVRTSASLPAYQPAYDAGWYDKQETANWTASGSSADVSILPNRNIAANRVRDLLRNDPTAGAAIERLLDLVVGAGMTLCATPDARALGISPEEANELGRTMQSEWRLFGDDPRKFNDAQRRSSINAQFRLMARTLFALDEATGVLTWREGHQRYSTCLLTIDPDRMSNPYGHIDTLTLRGGVEMDATYGEPLAYHIRNAHATDWWSLGRSWTWTRVPRTTNWGRPVFIHAFEPTREGQTRGISAFASLIGRLKMLGKFRENELGAAAINALFAAFIESDLPPEDVAQRLAAATNISAGREAFFDKALTHLEKYPVRVNGNRIPILPMGMKVNMNASPRQTATYPAFERAFLNSFASRVGLSGEQLSMDWSQTNYSSARAALNETWRTICRLSAIFVEQVVTPVYFSVMEEAFDKGYIKTPAGAPDFYEMPGAYLRANWIGPGRGYIDPVKEAEASSLRRANKTSTLQRECADQGLDYEAVLDQIAREEQEMKDRGISHEIPNNIGRSSDAQKDEVKETE